MKVSRLLMAAIFATACSSEPPVEPESRAPAPVPKATTGAAAETTGEAAEKPTMSAPRAYTETGPAAADARAAARGQVSTTAAAAGVNVQAAVLKDFQTRLDGYIDIHKKAESGGGKLKQTESPAEINNKQDVLAARIAILRADAAHGDIFTPEIRTAIRRLLAPELAGEDGRDAKAILKDDAPPSGSVPLKINAKYPDGLTRPTLPANLLLNLPQLPKGLEYRIVGKHLVLIDIDANIVVDYIQNAIA